MEEKATVDKIYRLQKSSSVDGELFIDFNETIWYPEVRKRTGEDVCLVVDNFSAHGNALPEFPGVEYISLPPNVTSVYQPMDMGIIMEIQKHARVDLLQQVVQSLENYSELREIGARQRDGMRGLKYPYPAHVLDTTQTLLRANEKLTKRTVVKRWLKAGILSPQYVQQLCNEISIDIPGS